MRYQIGIEPWSDGLWAEAKALAESHFDEVEAGVEPNRPFEIDQAQMQSLQEYGALRLFIARTERRMIGYCVWTIMLDPESKGLLIAQMGPWYVAPGHPRAAFEMFKASRKNLAGEGVKNLFPHHRVQGRGAHLGRFFEHQGAVKIQDTYSLWIGNDHA